MNITEYYSSIDKIERYISREERLCYIINELKLYHEYIIATDHIDVLYLKCKLNTEVLMLRNDADKLIYSMCDDICHDISLTSEFFIVEACIRFIETGSMKILTYSDEDVEYYKNKRVDYFISKLKDHII